MKTYFIFFIVIGVLLFSCEEEVKDGFDYKKLSTEFCDCTKASRDFSAQLNGQLQILNEGGRKDEVLGLLKKAGEEGKKAMKCCQEKKNLMNRAKPFNKNKLRKELEAQCNGIEALLIKKILGEIR